MKTTQLPPAAPPAPGGRGVFAYRRLTGEKGGKPLGQRLASLGTIKGSKAQIAADSLLVRILVHRLCVTWLAEVSPETSDLIEQERPGW